MQLAGLDRAFYLAVCKDTDELYQERIRHDAEAGLRHPGEGRAHHRRRPARRRGSARIRPGGSAASATTTPSAMAARRRSAIAAPACTPRPSRMAAGIARGTARRSTRREQEAGCAAHLYIPDLVPGEQIDAGEDWVSYRLPDGTEWRDGVPAAARPESSRTCPCRICRATIYRVGRGAGAAHRRLICTGCEAGGRWLSKVRCRGDRGWRHDPLAPPLSARRDRRALRLLRGQHRQSAGRDADRHRQVPVHRRLHARGHRRLWRHPRPDPHPCEGADPAELHGAAARLARGAGRHLLRRPVAPRHPRADPVRRHPVHPPPRPPGAALRPGADRRGASARPRRQRHVPLLPGAAERDQCRAAEGRRLHRHALSARQRVAARGQGSALHRHRLSRCRCWR